MPQLASEIMVGASGAVYVAPTGTALPTDIATALNVAFVDYGLITEDGIHVDPSVEFARLGAWQSLGVVRTIVTRRVLTLDFAMMQWNELTIPFAFGGGAFVPTTGPPAYYTYTFPDAQVRDTRAVVVQWADGTRDFRFVIPEFEVTDLADFTLAKATNSDLGVTGLAISGAAAGFTAKFISDDVQFAV